MWLDLVMILPLLALSLEKIIKGKKSIGFVLLMAYGIIADYYIAYMLVITLVLYFFYRIFEEIILETEAHLLTGIVIDWVELVKDFLKTIIHEFLPGFGLMLG